jgi:tRNA 5-methylaminomethyl-2-thiouridine biosynthesis bifunctional protein
MTTLACDIIVVGAGLAGASTAHALAKRGARVCILEAASSLAAKASGNRFGLLTPYISTKASPLETLYTVGYQFSQSVLISLQDSSSPLLHRCGAVQLPATTRLKTALNEQTTLLGAPSIRRLSATDASSVSGANLPLPAFYIEDAGFVEPARVVDRLCGHYSSLITVHLYSRALTIERDGDNWCVTSSGDHAGSTYYHAPHVVVCNAYEASEVSISSWLPLEAVRGQTVSVGTSNQSRHLQTIVAFGGYITPACNDYHFLGAHYRHDDPREEPSSEDTQDILNRAATWLPHMQLDLTRTKEARVCFRTSTVDRLPYIGQLPDLPRLQRIATSYRSGTDIRAKVPIAHHRGLYVNVGHGSRGLLSCPAGGELLARSIANESLAELAPLADLLTPDRLVYRLLELARNTV